MEIAIDLEESGLLHKGVTKKYRKCSVKNIKEDSFLF